MAEAGEVQTHCARMCLFLRTRRGFFTHRYNTHPALPASHSASLTHHRETKQSNPNKKVTDNFLKTLLSIIIQVKKRHFSHRLWLTRSALARSCLYQTSPVLFCSPPVKSERRCKQESSEAWPESRGSMTSYGSIFQVQASSE